MADTKDTGASKSIYIAKSNICANDSSSRHGSGIFASRNFEAGVQVEALNRPFVATIDVRKMETTCGNCYVWTEGANIGSRLYVKEDVKLSICTGCRLYRYCSKTCQKQAWARGHKHECKVLKSASDKNWPMAALGTMEILIRRKHGLISDKEWEMLCGLDTHISDLKENGKYSGVEMSAQGVREISKTQNEFDWITVSEVYARVLTNALTLITPSFDPLGIIFDPTLSYLNHSCDPNAFIVMDGAEIAIRTLNPIKKDEEIFISYIDHTNPYLHRQKALKSTWFFDCLCSKCVKGPTLTEDKWAIKPNQLSSKWKVEADKIKEQQKVALGSENYVGESEDERRVATLQTKIFADYNLNNKSPPAEALKIVERTMRMCKESQLYPPHRQPYAELRNDLILFHLGNNNRDLAWNHCAKRYLDILPKLYPQRHHPIRVIQNWQMAMLAIYMSSSPKNPGLVTLLIIMEVEAQSKLSHGENSSFAKSVRAKYDEVVTEIRNVLGDTTEDYLKKEMPHQMERLREMANSVD